MNCLEGTHKAGSGSSPYPEEGQGVQILFDDSVGQITEKIFTVEKEHILTFIKPLIPAFHEKQNYSKLVSLIKTLWDDDTHDDEVGMGIINEIAKHPAFPAVLCSMISTEPLTFIHTVFCLDEELQSTCMDLVLAQDKETYYSNFVGCLRTFLLPVWDDPETRSENFDEFLDLLDQEQFQAVAQVTVANFSIKELGRILSITKDKQTANGFIECFVQYYIGEPGYEDNLLLFIESIVAEVDTRERKFQPDILCELLKYGSSYERLSSLVINNAEGLTPKAFAYVRWCLPRRELKGLLKNYNVNDHCQELIGSLDQLIALERSTKKCISIIDLFIKKLSEEELQFFLTNMLSEESRSIPYLCPAMGMEAFQVFTMVFDGSLRSNLLRKALTSNVRANRNIVSSICRLPMKKQMLCNLAGMDIVSQVLVPVGEELVGKMATLKDFSDYIAKGLVEQNLEDKMAEMDKDYIRIPPLFIALAMTENAFRPQFIATLRYMTEDQLIAFAQQIPKRREVEIIDLMMSQASYDQMNKILSAIPFHALETFLRAKSEEMHAKFQVIKGKQEALKECVEKLLLPHAFENIGFDSFYSDTLQACTQQDGLLRTMLNPVNIVIKKHAKEVFDDYEVESPEDFSEIVNIMGFCESFKQALSGKESFFKTLSDLDPVEKKKEEVHQDFKTRKIPIKFRNENDITIISLRASGIVYDKDIKCFDISLEDKLFLDAKDLGKLKKYLSQSDQLPKIWSFFKEKKLCSISDLYTSMLVEEPSQLLNLMALAKRMGYK